MFGAARNYREINDFLVELWGIEPGLAEDIDDLAPWVWSFGQPGGQRRAIDELHGYEDVLTEGADIEDRDYIRVVEACHRLRVALEPRSSLGRAGTEIPADDLHGDEPVEVRIVGGEDFTRAAAAKPPPDLCSAQGNRRPQS